MAKGISVAPFIPYTYTTRLYGVRNKAVAPGKSQKINKRRAMFIPDSRVIKSNSLAEITLFKLIFCEILSINMILDWGVFIVEKMLLFLSKITVILNWLILQGIKWTFIPAVQCSVVLNNN